MASVSKVSGTIPVKSVNLDLKKAKAGWVDSAHCANMFNAGDIIEIKGGGDISHSALPADGIYIVQNNPEESGYSVLNIDSDRFHTSQYFDPSMHKNSKNIKYRVIGSLDVQV